jgi:hypothetical protein
MGAVCFMVFLVARSRPIIVTNGAENCDGMDVILNVKQSSKVKPMILCK